MKILIKPIATAALTALVLSSSSAVAATTLMFKFSSEAANDLTPAQATTLGLDAYQNIDCNPAGTFALSLDGITGSATCADYWQNGHLTALGQPYSSVIGGRQIGATGNQAVISLSGLNGWMATNSFSSYQVQVYYAGSSTTSENLVSTANVVSFINGSGTTFDTITIVPDGGTPSTSRWSGTGTVQTFTADTLTIDANYINDQAHGIAAIKIVGLTSAPEPSTAMLGGLGLLGLLRRRRA